MEQTAPIVTRKIPKTTKRLRELMDAHRAPDSQFRAIDLNALQESLDALSDPRRNAHRYNDYRVLAKEYWREAQYRQMAFHDTAKARECMALSAGCARLMYSCYDPAAQQENQPRGLYGQNWHKLDLDHAAQYFSAAVMAGAEDLARWLAEFHLRAPHNYLLRTDEETDRAEELLYLNRDEEAAQSCAIARGAKFPRLEIDAYEAILAGDQQRLYDALLTCIQGWRRSVNYVDLLKPRAIVLGRIALRRGFAVPIDTEDCPQCLIQPPEPGAALPAPPAPAEGFPWTEPPSLSALLAREGAAAPTP